MAHSRGVKPRSGGIECRPHSARLQGEVSCRSRAHLDVRCPDAFVPPNAFQRRPEPSASPDDSAVPAPQAAEAPEGALELEWVRPLGAGPLQAMHVAEGAVDDPLIRNPLERQQRLGTGWFGVILELEGVLVESAHHLHERAWLEMCEQFQLRTPLRFELERAEGMKAEQAVISTLLLTRDAAEARVMANKKEAIFERMWRERPVQVMPGAHALVSALRANEIPVAVTAHVRRDVLKSALADAGLLSDANVVLGADDAPCTRPEVDQYMAAAAALGRPPLRCAVLAPANAATEAAHSAGMQCVAVASRLRMYELQAADLVVRDMSGLTVQNLKQLFSNEPGRGPLASPPEHAREASPARRPQGVAGY